MLDTAYTEIAQTSEDPQIGDPRLQIMSIAYMPPSMAAMAGNMEKSTADGTFTEFNGQRIRVVGYEPESTSRISLLIIQRSSLVRVTQQRRLNSTQRTTLWEMP